MNKLIEILQKRQHKGRLLTREDFATGLTPKKTDKTRDIQGFVTSKPKVTTGPIIKTKP